WSPRQSRVPGFAERVSAAATGREPGHHLGRTWADDDGRCLAGQCGRPGIVVQLFGGPLAARLQPDLDLHRLLCTFWRGPVPGLAATSVCREPEISPTLSWTAHGSARDWLDGPDLAGFCTVPRTAQSRLSIRRGLHCRHREALARTCPGF